MRCVTQCPSGSYGNNQNWTCIGNCPAEVFGYKLDLANLCVEECPPPYFAFVSTRNCVTNCGAGLFGDTATRTCKDCDPKCPTCLSLSECLTCTSGLYLSFGVCL
jgi:proprotein convertase subtilisin/kexin type 5